MTENLNRILVAASADEVCAELHGYLDRKRVLGYLDELPEEYRDIAASGPDEVQDWFDWMKEDERVNQEGILEDVYEKFDAALRRLREFGFHRTE